MIPLELATKFLSTDEMREHAQKFVIGDGVVYATDGRVCLELPADPIYQPSHIVTTNMPKRAEGFFATGFNDPFTFRKISTALPTLDKIQCPNCLGAKKMSPCKGCDGLGGACPHPDCDDECYPDEKGEMLCRECDGHGTVEPSFQIKFGSRILSGFYIKLIMELPMLRVEYEDDERKAQEMLRFIFEGGRGVLMPMRPTGLLGEPSPYVMHPNV